MSEICTWNAKELVPATTVDCSRVAMDPGAATRGADTMPRRTPPPSAGARTESSVGAMCGFTALGAAHG